MEDVEDKLVKYCRACQVELVVGGNWTVGKAKDNNRKCRSCIKEYDRGHYNEPHVKLRTKEYTTINKEKRKEYSKEYHKENRDKEKEYYEDNKEKIKEHNNKPEIKRRRQEYDKEYRSKLRARKKRNEHRKNRKRTDLWYDAQCKLRVASNRLIKNCLSGGKKDFSGVDDLGCGKEVFLAHIESQFQPGMTWENRGLRGWHYDHIIPICEIDPTDREAVKQVLHYTNIRPLWAKDNIIKGQEDKKRSFKRVNSKNSLPQS